MEIQEKIMIIKDFTEYCKKFLELDQLPKIEFTQDKNWVLDIHSFGEYKNTPKSLKVYIGNRNLADILRTLSHELVHHRQNELGKMYPHAGSAGSDIENEANAISGVIMRNYGKRNELIYESNLTNTLQKVLSSKMKIFCDMDGVLTDFDAQFDHFFGVTPQEYYKEKGSIMLKKAIDDVGITFWSDMPYFPGAKELWSYISKYNPIILSSPSTFKYAQKGKLLWIKKHLNPEPQDIIFKQTGAKHEILSNMPKEQISKCILIDDFYKNIAPWKEMGAIGITHKSVDKTISILQKFRL